MSETLTPVASGSFERTPLVSLLVYCADKSLTGTLVLESPDGLRHAIYFREGSPSKVKTGDPFAHLGRVLVEMGLVDDRVVNETWREASERNVLHGRVLLESGTIDKSALLRGLREQAIRKIGHLFELPDATAYGFYEAKNLLEAWGGDELTPVDPLQLVWLGVRAKPDDVRVAATLEKLGDTVLRLHVNGDFKRFCLTDRARGVVDLLKVKPCSLRELVAADVASERETKLVVYAFLITRHLDLGSATQKPPVGIATGANTESSKPPDSSRSPESRALGRVKLRSMLQPARGSGAVEETPSAPVPQIPSNSEIDARRKEIRERGEKIDKEDYFTMLGVPRDAALEALQSAYFALAKKWHPDRLPEELSDVRETAGRVFARITEAFQTVSDPEKRAKYLEATKEGGGSPEEQARVQQVLEAQMEFQKAEILLKKNDLAGALRFASKAAQKDPEQPDYIALVAWLNGSQPNVSQDELRALVVRLDAVLKTDPNHQRALWYRGSLLKRIGETERAMMDFKRLIELDPRHVDAAREIRLYEMRNRSATSPSTPNKKDDEKKPSVFEKLFKK